jgi:hypothetical protein
VRPIRRLVLRTVALLALLSLPWPEAASAWGNDGQRGSADEFGTHDWILFQAAKGLGRQTRWIRLRPALRATDDPDSRGGIRRASKDVWQHYDRWGKPYGRADEGTGYWFRVTARRLRAGRKRSASKALGIMSHLISDVAQPMHTDNALGAEARVHGLYEDDVDARSVQGAGTYRFRYDGRDRADPEQRTARVARAAHPYYNNLVKTFDDHGYNARVDRITRGQLNRAANAVADLISALP